MDKSTHLGDSVVALRRLRLGLTLGLFFFHCFASAKVEVLEDSSAAKHPDVHQIEKSLSKDVLKASTKNTPAPTNSWSTSAPEPQNATPKRRVSRKAKNKKGIPPVAAAPVKAAAPVTASPAVSAPPAVSATPAAPSTQASITAPAVAAKTNPSSPAAKSPPFLNSSPNPEPLPGDVFGIRLVRVAPKIEKPAETQAKKVAPKEFKILLVKTSPDLNRRKIPRPTRRAASR